LNPFLRSLALVVSCWLALAGWWLLLVGTNAGLELVAAACAALLGTALALALRRHRLLRFRFQARWLAQALRVPWSIVRELGLVTWALLLHVTGARPVRSAYRAIPFPTGRADAVSAGRRAVITLADAMSPNSVPVDMDCERGVVLRHELDPRHASDPP
jgi:ABC-type amino acid transport system permease subunit